MDKDIYKWKVYWTDSKKKYRISVKGNPISNNRIGSFQIFIEISQLDIVGEPSWSPAEDEIKSYAMEEFVAHLITSGTFKGD